MLRKESKWRRGWQADLVFEEKRKSSPSFCNQNYHQYSCPYNRMSESGKEGFDVYEDIRFTWISPTISVQVETTKTHKPLEYSSTILAEESLTFTNPLEDIEDYEEDEVVPSPVLDPDLEAKVNLENIFFLKTELILKVLVSGSPSLRTHQRERSHLCQRAFFGLLSAIGTRTQGLAAHRWKQTTSQIYSTAIGCRLSRCRPRASVSHFSLQYYITREFGLFAISLSLTQIFCQSVRDRVARVQYCVILQFVSFWSLQRS